MVSRATQILNRIAWIIPVFLLGLAIHQGKSAYDLQSTLSQGELAEAEIIDVFSTDRVDVTYDYVHIRTELEDGTVIEKEELSLPHSLLPIIEDRETVEVRAQPGSAQEIVIAEVGATQSRIAAMNAGISFIGAIAVALGLFFWQRFLRREGDPSARGVSEPDPDHPARQAVRDG